MIKKLVRKFLHKTSIKVKLLMVTFALILLPLSVTSVIMFMNTSNMYTDSVYKLSNMSLDYTGQVLESRLALALNTADIVASNAAVQRVLSEEPSEYSLSEQLEDMRNLTLYLQGFTRNSAIARVRLSVRSGFIYSNEGNNFINADKLAENKEVMSIGSGKSYYPSYWMRNTITGRDGTVQEVVSCVKVIHNTSNFDDILGYVFVDIPVGNINSIMEQADITGDGFIYTVNQDSKVMAAAGSGASPGDAAELVHEISLSDTDTLKISNEEFQIQIKKLPKFDWKIISLVSLKKIHSERNNMAIFTLALLVTLAGATLLMSNFIYKVTLNRIQRIVVSMKKVQEGSLDTELPADSDDEIGRIEKNYNYMIHRIKELIKKTLELVEKARDSELKALQAQINPHFLYNTINTISWTARDYGAEKVCSMLRALSDFYKLSLQPGIQEVTLKDELRHVELYVEIQNMRYGDMIVLEINVPEELKRCLMLNMILQTLVENSVLHGIMAKEERRGRIVIKGDLAGDDMVISVIDDGVGMTEETLAKLTLYQSSNGDYGVFNVQERIVLKYGEKYGLSFESHPGGGTRVDIRIPKNVQEEDLKNPTS